jgi:hypothetical protein
MSATTTASPMFPVGSTIGERNDPGTFRHHAENLGGQDQ